MRQSAAIKKVVAVWTIICMMLPSFVFTVSAEKENISLANVVTEESKLVFDGFTLQYGTNGKIQASVIVTNTGAQDGEEIVQLYLRDIVRSITPPVQELKGFKRVALKAGESKKVTFDIDVDMLKFYDSTLDYVAEPGEFQVMIGGNSKEVKTASFTLK